MLDNDMKIIVILVHLVIDQITSFCWHLWGTLMMVEEFNLFTEISYSLNWFFDKATLQI